EIIPQDCAGFGFVCKAHPAAHIEIRVGGCNAVDGPKDKQDVELFLSGALNEPIRILVITENCCERPFHVDIQECL
ncbi:MAG: hypothetical protein WCE56_13260, partial [Desulfobacterales bacterium]